MRKRKRRKRRRIGDKRRVRRVREGEWRRRQRAGAWGEKEDGPSQGGLNFASRLRLTPVEAVQSEFGQSLGLDEMRFSS